MPPGERTNASRGRLLPGLEWKSLSKVGCIVHTGKSDARVELRFGKEILNPEAVGEAIGMIPLADPDYCFPVQRAMRHSKLSTYFTRLCKGAGIDGHSFHDLRKTYLVDLMANGQSIEQAAKAAGHARISTTKGYVKD